MQIGFGEEIKEVEKAISKLIAGFRDLERP